MVANIECIELFKNNNHKDKPTPVVIRFKFPCTYTLLDVPDLLLLLKLWIIGEEEKYPISEGYQGRWMLFDKIKEVFEKTEVEGERQ